MAQEGEGADAHVENKQINTHRVLNVRECTIDDPAPPLVAAVQAGVRGEGRGC